MLNTLDDLYASVNVALKKAGFPERRKEEVRAFLGNGLQRLIEESVPENTEPERICEVMDFFKAHYLEHCEDRTAPFSGIMEMLGQLKERGYQMAIVSNKPDMAVKELADKHFAEVLTVAIGEREGVKRKPAPDSVLEAMRILHVDREDVIYVGDSEVDRETARNAGVPCILVTWGFREEAFLRSLEPEFLIHQPEEITGIV